MPLPYRSVVELHRARSARDGPVDLGSSGGIDVLLSARRVGPTGR
jgi:hypothetical protein